MTHVHAVHASAQIPYDPSVTVPFGLRPTKKSAPPANPTNLTTSKAESDPAVLLFTV
jgi:hypothetical protein